MQPGIIYNYLSILKAERPALIEEKELWVVAGTVHLSAVPMPIPMVPQWGLGRVRYCGFWTEIKLGGQMSLYSLKTAV